MPLLTRGFIVDTLIKNGSGTLSLTDPANQLTTTVLVNQGELFASGATPLQNAGVSLANASASRSHWTRLSVRSDGSLAGGGSSGGLVQPADTAWDRNS